MPEAKLTFPNNFLWGTSTASHAYEGQLTDNNWYAWEQAGRVVQRQQSGLGCDWWGGRWREDFDRAQETCQNAVRISIEWSRIQPDPGRWDEDAIDFYRQMVRGILDRGMLPIITLHHFSEPMWVTELGSWQNDEIIHPFKIYVHKIVEALMEYASIWCTINEPNLLAIQAYWVGIFPPGNNSLFAYYNACKNIINGHASAYHIIHNLQPSAKVSLAHRYHKFSPAIPYSPLDRWVANIFSKTFNDLMPNALVSGKLKFFGVRKRIPALKNTQDYFGVNYYPCENISNNFPVIGKRFSTPEIPQNSDLKTNNLSSNFSDGFFQALTWAKDYKLPILVTGNGTYDSDGGFRSRSLIEHIHKLWRAVNYNWKIFGYLHWSLIDNFEWEHGWTKRYGLWSLDYKTQKRIKRSSADLYQDICQSNSLSSEIIAKYSPEVLDELFPT